MAAAAQCTDPEPSKPKTAAEARAERWGGTLEAGAAPRIGKSKPLISSSDIIDEGEGSASVSVKRKGKWGLTNAQLKAGVSTAPQLFDDGDPSSATYLEASVGDADIPFFWHTDPSDIGYCAERAAPDYFRPFANYRWTRNYDDFLQARSRDDHRVAAGIRYRDVRAAMGTAKDITKTPGLYWEASAEVSRTWSTNAAKEMLAPSATIKVASRPLFGTYRAFGGTRIYARAQGDLMFYDSARAPDGRKREDERVRIGVGLDMSGWTKRLTKPLIANLEVQYQKQWSNEPSVRHERWYLVPSVTFKVDL